MHSTATQYGRAAHPQHPPAEDSGDQIYHVVFAPDDIRELTIEQLEDCFRLGVITAATHLWTDGMDRWQTLKEAAELDEPEAAPVSQARPAPPSRRRSPPPSPRRRASQAPSRAPQRNAPPSHAPPRHAPPSHPPPSHAPPSHAPPSRRGTAPLSVVSHSGNPPASVAAPPQPDSEAELVTLIAPPPGARQMAPPVALVPPVAQISAARPAPAPLTLAPPVEELEVPQRRGAKLRARFQATLLWSALIAGLLITAHRNDLLLRGARHVGKESLYLELEQRWLGGPASRTPRALASRLHGEAAQVTPPVPTPPLQQNAAPSESTASPAPAAEPPTSGAGSTTATPTKPEPAEAAEASAAKQTSKLTSASAPDATAKRAPVAPKPAKAKRSTAKTKAAAATAKPKKEEATTERAEPAPKPGTDEFLRMNMRKAVKEAGANKKKRVKGAAFDPLNGDI